MLDGFICVSTRVQAMQLQIIYIGATILLPQLSS